MRRLPDEPSDIVLDFSAIESADADAAVEGRNPATTRKPETQERWIEEAEFIERTDPQRPGRGFNDDPACFARYVAMQAGFARENGFGSLADRMIARVGLAKWVVRFVRTAPWEIHYPVGGRDEVWGGVYAPTADEAWDLFLARFPACERDWFRRLGVEKQAR